MSCCSGYLGDFDDPTPVKHKSVLDYVEVKHLDGLPKPPKGGSGTALPKGSLEVVAACPRCGAPVYGRKTLLATDVPEVRFSCDCARPSVTGAFVSK